MDYRQTLEQQYVQRIQDILTPLLGYGRVRAKVSADLDFTSFEQTQEMYNPELQSLRSEQSMEEKRKLGGNASGVPGSLSNTAPTNASLQQSKNNNNPNAKNNTQVNNANVDVDASDYRKQSTKNFELDKTISHTKNQPGTIKRITVAVLVDDKPTLNPKTKKWKSNP